MYQNMTVKEIFFLFFHISADCSNKLNPISCSHQGLLLQCLKLLAWSDYSKTCWGCIKITIRWSPPSSSSSAFVLWLRHKVSPNGSGSRRSCSGAPAPHLQPKWGWAENMTTELGQMQTRTCTTTEPFTHSIMCWCNEGRKYGYQKRLFLCSFSVKPV